MMCVCMFFVVVAETEVEILDIYHNMIENHNGNGDDGIFLFSCVFFHIRFLLLLLFFFFMRKTKLYTSKQRERWFHQNHEIE